MNGENDKNLPMKGESEPPDRVFSTLGSWERGYATRAYGAEEGESKAGGFSLRDILYALFRHKWDW